MPNSTVRSRLLLLVLACIVPTALAAVGTIYYVYSEKRQQFEMGLAETTRALALVVDQEIARREAITRTLADSPQLTRGDIAGFYDYARSIAPGRDTVIVLANMDGSLVFNTRRPLGDKGLPRLTDFLPQQDVLAARQGTVFSGVYYAPIGKAFSFATLLPVVRDGQVRYLLAYGGYAAALQKVFQNQKMPPGWVATVLDKDGTVVARNLEPELYVGRKATERLRSRMDKARSGIFESRGIDEREILSSFATAPAYGWTVAVGVPLAEVGSPMHAALVFGGISALLLAIALWAAALVGRGLLRPIRTVQSAAQHMANAEPVELQPTGLAEMDTVLGALAQSSEALHRSKAQMQERVREALAEAEKAHQAVLQNQRLEALGQLTGGVAHDFNNLLMVVGNYAHLLRARRKELAESPELAGVERAVATGAKLTRQLLAFARRQPVRPEPVALQLRLPDIAALLKASLGSRIALECEVDPDTLAVQVDPAEFELALINLAVNARDAMPEGGSLRITAGNADGQCVRIAVADQGSGIPEELLARVFEPFVTTKPVGHGTGLGLSQVYGFARQAGGDARIDSIVGQGTTVSLLLPGLAAGTQLPAEDKLPGTSALLAERELLLVEDNEELARVTQQVLDAAGCHVTRAASGVAARDLLQAGATFDAVLSDIRMPGGMDGIALARWIREAHPSLPVVLMTGYSAELAQAQSLGLQVLPKPCPAGLLIETLDRALRSKAVVPG